LLPAPASEGRLYTVKTVVEAVVQNLTGTDDGSVAGAALHDCARLAVPAPRAVVVE